MSYELASEEYRWVDLSKYWDRIVAVGEAREVQKHGFDSTHSWREDGTHVPGFVGECVVAKHQGLKADPSLRISGDGGTDLDHGIDVKAVTRWWPPYLKHPPDAKHWPEWFALAWVDLERQGGVFIGVATATQVRRADLIDWGYGLRHSMHPDQLFRAPQ